jgi:anti-anti-sigma regulatory factor
MTTIDATGLKALEDAAVRLRDSGRTAIFCGAPDQPRAIMRQAGFDEVVGSENITANIDKALVRASQLQ